MKNLLTAALLAAALTGSARSAVIWEETFDSYTDGTTNGTAGTWSVDVSACSFDGDDHFEVRSGQMQGNDLDGEAVWTTETIDISGQGTVSISVSVSDGGGGLEGSDYIRLYYKLDGGAETLFSTNGDNSGNFGNLTASQTGLTGASLQLIVKVVNGANTEFIAFDNVQVENAAVPSNQPPVLSAIGNQSVTVSNALNFTVSAADADSDPIVLSASNLPPGAVFNTVTNAGSVSNTFNWTGAAPTGTYTATFYAHDGTTNDLETITISVSEAPALPDSILFDFANDAALYGALDDQPGPVAFTNSGLPATFTASDGEMNRTASGFGINAAASGDDTAGFDVGEWIDIVFDTAIRLTNVNVSSWGTGDQAAIYINSISNGVMNTTGNHPFNLVVPAGQVLRIESTAGTVGNGWSLDSLTVSTDTNTPSPANNAPVLAAIGNKSVTVSNALNFTVSAADADSDPIVLSASNLPPGAVFNTVTNAGSVSNTFNWTGAAPTGTYTATFYAHDGTTNDLETITITVTNGPVIPVNNPPVLAAIGHRSVTVSNALNFTVSAADADNDLIMLSASNVPAGALFNSSSAMGSATGTFNWVSAAPTGTYSVTFFAHDGTTNDLETITITVTNAPVSPPVTGAVWNVVYNHPQQSGSASAFPNQFLIRDALVERIDSLESGDNAVLATFTFSAEAGAGVIMNAMDAALDRGANVRFIADGDINIGTVYGGTNSLLDLSNRSPNPLTLVVDGSTSGIMHDKLGLFDYGGSNQWVFTASWNFTLGASADQWNIALEARSPSLYAIYKAETDELLAGRFHDDPLKSHAHDASSFSLDGSWGTNFVRFAPYPDATQGGNNAERDITNLIAQAQSEIVFALNKLNREPVRDALIAAADRGVAIQGVMPRSDTDPGGVSDDIYSYLTNSANYATTNIVQMLPAYSRADYSTLDAGESDLIHAKYMVIDPQSTNAVVIHGSANWTAQALVNDNDNDENVVFLRHNAIAAVFYENFQRITGTGAYDEGNSTLVSWDFQDDNQIADGGIPANETQTVVRVPAPSGYTYTDDALSCNGWQSGSGTKYWETEFSSLKHSDIKVSSVQLGSSTGPADFKLQYKTSAGGTYADVPFGEVTVPDGGNGVLTRVLLPAACNDQPGVFLRWIMTSNTSIREFDNVQSGGRGSIDDIMIVGTAYDQPPVLDAIGDRNVFEGETLSFTVTASDPVDGDSMTLSATNLPAGATFTNDVFTWSNAAPAGTYTVTFTATDKDGSDSESIDVTVIEKPLLLISEIADPDGTGGGDYRFVELYNAGTNHIDLAAGSWHLSRQANGNTWADVALTGSVTAASTYVIAYDTAAFQSAYGFAPDQSDPDVDGTGDDAYFLYFGGGHSSGILIDIYGTFDTDGSGEAWEYTDGRAVRKSAVLQPNTTWTSSEWVLVDGATTNEVAPGVRGSLPQFQGLTDQSALAGEPLSFDVAAEDPIDGDAVTVSAVNLPPGAAFDGTTFHWGAAAPAGIYTPSFIASDADGSTTGTVTLTVIEKPLLLISEIADPDVEDAELYRFVELYNAGTAAIDLSTDGWHLSRQVNGGSWDNIELTGTVAAGSAWVIANSAAEFQTAYGFAPEQESSSVSGTGDDAYFLYFGGDHTNGTLIDIYGEIDTDGTDTAWDYENSRAVRNNSILEPNTVWTATEWTLTPEAVLDDMTPGEHGPTPEFQGLENPFVWLGDDLNLTVTAVNTVKTDTITLSATALPAGATFAAKTGTDSVSSTLLWNSPPAGTYMATFGAAGDVGTTTKSIIITVSDSARIAGKFYGWDGDTIFKLDNGQFWQHRFSGGKTVPVINRPTVTITNHLQVDRRMYIPAINDYVQVAPLEVIESDITNAFSGLYYNNIYQLDDGTAWKQTSHENIAATDVDTTWRWVKNGTTFLRFLDRDDRVIGTCTVKASAPPADTTIRSRIDGWFRGWKLDRIFMLENGQFWQQITADDSMDTLYRPAAAVSNHLGTGTWRLYVESAGPPAYVEVRRLTGVTRTAIDGTFYGFGLGNVYRMQNGGWWRQTSLESSASVRSNPEILIWDDDGTDILEMPDEGRAVEAEQLNVVTESTIVETFRGLRYARYYNLANDQDWAQISSENIPSDQQNPAVMVWTEDDNFHLLARDSSDRPIGSCTVISPWDDDDGDGVPNVEELIAGTSLLDRNDLFILTMGRPDSEGRAVLNWILVPGRTYTIEWTPSLLQDFQPLETLTDWTENSWTDTVNPPGSGGFYRIRVRLTD